MTPPAAMPQTHPGRLIKDTRIADDPHEGQQTRPWKACWPVVAEGASPLAYRHKARHGLARPCNDDVFSRDDLP